jgi:hypothetical protein
MHQILPNQHRFEKGLSLSWDGQGSPESATPCQGLRVKVHEELHTLTTDNNGLQTNESKGPARAGHS